LEHDGRVDEVTVLIPAYKESEYITVTLSGIVKVFRSASRRFEIIVVLDDVPGDETGARVSETARKFEEIRVIERKGRRGVGDAIAVGTKQATGDIVIIVMGDQSEDPVDVLKLADKARTYDIVFTNRFRKGRPQGYPRVKYFANRVCNISVRLVFHVPYSDITNAFKAYRRSTLEDINLTSKGFEIFLELPLRAMRRARRTTEVNVRHAVMKRKIPKLSVTRDGYKYLSLLISLLADAYFSKKE
jgi:glycosyltransferase involved in cell wall biosynthesis